MPATTNMHPNIGNTSNTNMLPNVGNASNNMAMAKKETCSLISEIPATTNMQPNLGNSNSNKHARKR